MSGTKGGSSLLRVWGSWGSPYHQGLIIYFPWVQGEDGSILQGKKKKLKIQTQRLFLRKVPSYQMLKAVRMFKLDPCAAPLLFLRNLQNLHLWLMERSHWAGLGIHSEWLFPHLSQMCLLLPPTFKPHASLLQASQLLQVFVHVFHITN